LWGVHVQAHLLNVVGDVGPREGHVLEGSGQASVGRRVGDWRPISVDRRGTGLAAGHANPLQDVDGVLRWWRKTLRPALGGDAEEVVKRLQIFNREL
jgi:hypothetical protein